MVPAGPATLLRIYLDEAHQYDGRSLYEELVVRARAAGLAGATVLRGPLGYGARSRLHHAKLLQLAQDLPMVVEIVDQPDPVEQFVDAQRDLLTNVLVTFERVTVWRAEP